MNLSMQMYL